MNAPTTTSQQILGRCDVCGEDCTWTEGTHAKFDVLTVPLKTGIRRFYRHLKCRNKIPWLPNCIQ